MRNHGAPADPAVLSARPPAPQARYAVLVLRLMLVMLGLWIAGCSRTDPAPAPPPSAEPRIVVLSPALAAILDDMGYADHAVGRHGWDMVLDPALPVCGEQNAINYEALLRAGPTHVLTEWGSRELPAKLIAMAAEHAWTLRDFRMLTLDDIDLAAAELATLFPDSVPADRIARFRALVAGPPPSPRWEGRVLLLMSASPQITALGPGSAHHELLVRAGGVPAITEGSPAMPMHAEDVLRLAPDAIVLIRPGSETGDDPTAARQALGTILELDIPAVVNERFELVTGPFTLLPSTPLVEVADQLRTALNRWADE